MNDTGGCPPVPRDPREALSGLFNEHYEPLVKTLIKQTHVSLRVAEDVVQDVFTEYSGTVAETGALPPGLAETPKPFAYIMRSVLNRLGDIQEKKSHNPSPSEALAPAAAGGPSLAALDEIADPNQHRPLSLLVREEEFDKIDEAMAALDDADRRIIAAVVAGRTHKELAAELGLDAKKMLMPCARAWRKLREALSRYSSTCIQPADSLTYKPRTRRAALEAIQTLPSPHDEYLFERYVLGVSEIDMACARDLPPDEIARRVARAEELFAKKYGMKLPADLEAALKNLARS